MAKKKQTPEELAKLATEACVKFFRLSKLFFSTDDIYNVNEIPESNEFHQVAKDMAAELEIDWEKMSHEDSNRIVINLLADHYAAIRVEDGYVFGLSATCTPKQKLKPQSDGGDKSEE